MSRVEHIITIGLFIFFMVVLADAGAAWLTNTQQLIFG